MPGIDFRQLRANVSMAEVLELLGFVVLERKGDQVRGECPLNVSDKPITICDYVGTRPLKVEWIRPDGNSSRQKSFHSWLLCDRNCQVSSQR